MSRLAALWSLGLLVASACGEGATSRRAESVPDEALPIAADTIVAPYSGFPEATWVGEGRWLTVFPEHDAAEIVDFGAGTLGPVGGRNNQEIVKPYDGFALADTAVVADWSKGRLTLWGPDGSLAGTVPGPAALGGRLPKARDAAGQYYFEIPPNPGRDGSGNRDSTAIVRGNPTMTSFDTVAHLAPVDLAEVQLSTGRRYERLILAGTDQWGVRPDGRLWIARVNANRVNTIAGGKERRGEPLPDPVLEVKRIDREVFISSFPEEVRSSLQGMPFAPFKPAFDKAFAGPDGLVWLRKSRAYGDSIRRYHVVDTAGLLARSFTTVGDGRLVAAGRGAVLMAEQFSGGVRLMELRVPSGPPAPADSTPNDD
ncbi:MAG: hypothetical protein AB7R55_10830 [Gemmatimonadales bacterium]